LYTRGKEALGLFRTGNVADKQITAEACGHHMYFSQQDYIELGNQIKCNPSIKTGEDKEAVLKAVIEDRIDVIASDHARHTWEEKSEPYLQAPSGLPLLQHSLLMMLSHWAEGKISLEKIVDKMCHTPSLCFRITDRGFL